MLYSEAQYNVELYIEVHYSVVLYSEVHYTVVLYSEVWSSVVLYSEVQYSVVLYSEVQYSVVLYSSIQNMFYTQCSTVKCDLITTEVQWLLHHKEVFSDKFLLFKVNNVNLNIAVNSMQVQIYIV